ncbi:hypothetical protein ABK040_007607 [Willaertia magna]
MKKFIPSLLLGINNGNAIITRKIIINNLLLKTLTNNNNKLQFYHSLSLHSNNNHNHNHHDHSTCSTCQSLDNNKIEEEDEKINQTLKQNESFINLNEYSINDINKIFLHLRTELQKTNTEQYSIALLQRDDFKVNTYIVLHCLNVELANIKDNTKSTATALLRLNWWKEQVKHALNGQPSNVPVLIGLSYLQKCLKDKGEKELTFSNFRNIFKYREIDLKWKQPMTLADIENYSNGVYSTLIMNNLQFCNLRNVHTDHVAAHLGRSLGIITLLRSVPFIHEHQTTYLPAQLCALKGINEEQLLKKENTKELEDVVFQVADLAKGHLDLARELKDQKDSKTSELLISKDSYPIFYSSCIVEVFLEKLQKYNFNIFDQRLDPRALRFAILTKTAKKRYWSHDY